MKLLQVVFNYAVFAPVITQWGSIHNCLLHCKRTEVSVGLIAYREFSAFVALKPVCHFFLKYTRTYTALGPFSAWLMCLCSCKANTCYTSLVSHSQTPLVLPELYLVLSYKLLWWLRKFDDISFVGFQTFCQIIKSEVWGGCNYSVSMLQVQIKCQDD